MSVLTMCFQIQQNLTRAYIESFRLQKLEPYTDYVVQMRCIHKDNLGYWSDWSPNATARTPEASESEFISLLYYNFGQPKKENIIMHSKSSNGN